MADTRISALNALLTASEDDLLAIVDDPAGAPETKKITASNFLTSLLAIGSIFTVDGTGSQNLAVQNTWYQVTQLDADCACSENTTPDAANNRIQFNATGKYVIAYHVTFNGDNSETYELRMRLVAGGTVALVNTTSAHEFGNFFVGNIANLTALGAVDVAGLPASLELEVRCTSGSNAGFDVLHAQLIAFKAA